MPEDDKNKVSLQSVPPIIPPPKPQEAKPVAPAQEPKNCAECPVGKKQPYLCKVCGAPICADFARTYAEMKKQWSEALAKVKAAPAPAPAPAGPVAPIGKTLTGSELKARNEALEIMAKDVQGPIMSIKEELISFINVHDQLLKVTVKATQTYTAIENRLNWAKRTYLSVDKLILVLQLAGIAITKKEPENK
jgi:hypothetical protein